MAAAAGAPPWTVVGIKSTWRWEVDLVWHKALLIAIQLKATFSQYDHLVMIWVQNKSCLQNPMESPLWANIEQSLRILIVTKHRRSEKGQNRGNSVINAMEQNLAGRSIRQESNGGIRKGPMQVTFMPRPEGGEGGEPG